MTYLKEIKLHLKRRCVIYIYAKPKKQMTRENIRNRLEANASYITSCLLKIFYERSEKCEYFLLNPHSILDVPQLLVSGNTTFSSLSWWLIDHHRLIKYLPVIEFLRSSKR